MDVLFIVLPLAVIMAMVALVGFFWAVHKGQFDDLDTPAYRAILDEMDPKRRDKPEKSAKKE